MSDRFGSRLVGALARVEGGRAWFAHPAFTGEVAMPLGSLLVIESVESPVPADPLPARRGRYIDETADIAGCLVPVATADGATIGWLPEASLVASAPAATNDGRPRQATIRYRPSGSDAAGFDHIGMVGARIDYSDGRVRFMEALEGGAIAESGLALPVRLLAVAPRADGRFVDVAGLAPDMVTCLLRGAEGTNVDLRFEEPDGAGERTLRVRRRRLPDQVDMLSLEQIHSVQQQFLAGREPADGADPVQAESVAVLVSGESIPCRVESLDTDGLRVRLTAGDAVTIPSEDLQALELSPASRLTLSPEKFRSLVTLPRAQRGQPPTHLVRSPAGDYLRGRVLSLDAGWLLIAIDSDPRGRPTKIPREDVTRIIWLHPEVLEDDWAPPKRDAAVGMEVEAVANDGGRRRLVADAVEGNVLSGRHAVLGAIRIDVDSADRLLLGGMADIAPFTLPYAKWQLRPATEPRNLPPRKKAANGD